MCQSIQQAVVGFIGLGVMGGPMAGHVSRAGHAVRLFDVAPGRAAGIAASLEGARDFDSPARLARECDDVVTMVANGEVVHSLIAGDDGLPHGLAPEAMLLDPSSCETWLTERSAAPGREPDASVSELARWVEQPNGIGIRAGTAAAPADAGLGG